LRGVGAGREAEEKGAGGGVVGDERAADVDEEVAELLGGGAGPEAEEEVFGDVFAAGFAEDAHGGVGGAERAGGAGVLLAEDADALERDDGAGGRGGWTSR